MWMMWLTEALAQEPVEGPSLKRMARPICVILTLFVIPTVIEIGRRRGWRWAVRADPERVPDVED